MHFSTIILGLSVLTIQAAEADEESECTYDDAGESWDLRVYKRKLCKLGPTGDGMDLFSSHIEVQNGRNPMITCLDVATAENDKIQSIVFTAASDDWTITPHENANCDNREFEPGNLRELPFVPMVRTVQLR